MIQYLYFGFIPFCFSACAVQELGGGVVFLSRTDSVLVSYCMLYAYTLLSFYLEIQ